MKQIIILSVLLLSTAAGFAQVTDPAGNQISLGMYADTLSEIRSFQVKNRNGGNQLSWKAAEQHADGVYFIYRSTGNADSYQLLAALAGNGICTEGEVPYTYMDRAPDPGYNYYKILHIGRNNTYLVSEQVTAVSGLLSSDRQGKK